MSRSKLGALVLLGAPLAAIAVVALVLDADSVAEWIYVALVGVAIAATARWELARRARAERDLEAAYEALRSVDLITEVALSDLELDDLLDELLARITTVMDASTATILLLSEDGTMLESRASVGLEEEVEERYTTPVGRGIAGQIAATSEAVIVNDVEGLEGVSPFLQGRARSVAGCALRADGRVIGVLRVGSDEAGHFSDDDLRVLQLAADRAAAAITRANLSVARERSRLGAEHARRHLAMLAEASAALDWMLDEVEPVLHELGEVIVPSFADWFAVDLVEGTDSSRVVRAHSDPTAAARAEELERAHPEWPAAVWRVIRTGRASLVFDVAAPTGTTREEDADHFAVATQLGLESCMVVAIRARGLSLGALTFATAPGRRGYRPSDVAAAQDLAGHVATALERVALYRETEQAGARAAEHAARLRRLMEASMAVNATMARDEVLRVLVTQARRVTGADSASTRLIDEGGVVAAQDPAGNGEAVGAILDAPLLGGDGSRIGELRVARADGDDFTEDDESVLVSLAQMGSVASEKAHLYDAVRASEARLKALVDASPLAILELDRHGSVQSFNRAAAELFGDPVHFPHPADEELNALILVGAKQIVTGAEVPGHRADGLPVVLSVSLAPLRDDVGDPQGVLAVVADVTDRKQLEEQVVAGQRMEAVSRLAGGLAHDFNNLLTVIRGYSELLLMRIGDEDPLREEIEQIRDAVSRAAELTSQLHTISRRQVVQLAHIDVDEVVAALAPIIRRVAGSDIEVDLDVQPGAGAVSCDRTQFEQCLLNLAINARDAMPGGGQLRIHVRDVEQSVAREGEPPPGRYVRVTVRDTGVGMDEETLEHWFEPFFATAPRGRLKGLGLATVHGIVTQNGGFIRASSDGTEGVTFVIDFPRVGDRAEAADEEAERPWGGDERVLLVEDEDAVRAYAREVLERHGYEVLAAASGADALRLVNDDEVLDLLVTDVVMPNMNGRELAAAITELRPGLPVLFMSGYTEGVLQASGTLDPGTRLVSKPFHPDELAKAVRLALDDVA